LINLGASLASTGDAEGALKAWKRAAERDPLGAEAPFNIGYLAFTRGEMEAALKSFEGFFQLQGRDGEAFFLVGRASERLGRKDESQRMIAQAIRLSPRVERWSNQPLPNLQRLRIQFDITDLRLSQPNGIWTDKRLARRAGGQDVAAWLESVQK